MKSCRVKENKIHISERIKNAIYNSLHVLKFYKRVLQVNVIDCLTCQYKFIQVTDNRAIQYTALLLIRSQLSYGASWLVKVEGQPLVQTD